jgi:hypothetical protein
MEEAMCTERFNAFLTFLTDPTFSYPYEFRPLVKPGQILFINVFKYHNEVPGQEFELVRPYAITIMKSGICTNEGLLKGANISGRYRLYKIIRFEEFILTLALLVNTKSKEDYQNILDWVDIESLKEKMDNYFELVRINKLATYNRIRRIKEELSLYFDNNINIIESVTFPKVISEGMADLFTDFSFLIDIIDLMDIILSFPEMPSVTPVKNIRTKFYKLHKETITALLNSKSELYYPGLYWLPHVFKQHVPDAPHSIIAKVTLKLIKMFHQNMVINYDSIRYELRKKDYRITLHSLKKEDSANKD